MGCLSTQIFLQVNLFPADRGQFDPVRPGLQKPQLPLHAWHMHAYIEIKRISMKWGLFWYILLDTKFSVMAAASDQSYTAHKVLHFF